MNAFNKEIRQKAIELINKQDIGIFNDYDFKEVQYINPEVYKAWFAFEVNGIPFFLNVSNNGSKFTIVDESDDLVFELPKKLSDEWYDEIVKLFAYEYADKIEEEMHYDYIDSLGDSLIGIDR